MPTRDEILLDYLDRLAYPPYPVQEEALFAWGECEDGVLLCAPTGTGKTLVAEAAVYEALRAGQEVYYSTPLIALTDQKLIDLQETVARWGYPPQSVGLVTGHRTINPDAPVKVVVAEVLLNRLLHREAFDFSRVFAVVMDEFHNFNEPQRGIVWELALMLLPKHVRVMLLSATVGAAAEFVNWIFRSTGRRVTLVQGTQRKVPLAFDWVGDELLADLMERIARGTDAQRRTPALVFCFDRELCWSTADVLRGKDLFSEGQRQALLARLDAFDFGVGAGNKLRPSLARGVGIHHAGLLPRYRRVVETLFQEKLLPVCVCTETLAAGINLPARSVILTTLVKGPRDKKRLIEVGSAQQMFGRAGRPQYDKEGNVYAVAHEDDVKLAKWKVKYDSIPEETKDPGLMKAKKSLLKKKPTRRPGFTYWNAEQFIKLQTAPAAKLASRGRLSWRWLAYLLEADPAVEPIREVVRNRLMPQPEIDAEQKRLTKMLVTLGQMDVVTLAPPPPPSWINAARPAATGVAGVGGVGGGTSQTGGEATDDSEEESDDTPSKASDDAVDATDATVATDATDATDAARSTTITDGPGMNAIAPRLTLGNDLAGTRRGPAATRSADGSKSNSNGQTSETYPADDYAPLTATPTPRLAELTAFRAVHPLYGLFLMDHLAIADDHELLQILESLLEMPGSVAKLLRVPRPEVLPPGRLTIEVIDPAVLTRGLVAHEDLYPPADQSDVLPELRRYPVPLAQKIRLMFESEIDHAGGLFVTPVWCAGDLLLTGGSFDSFVRSRDLVKQEGIIFKHFLRLILLLGEFRQLTPRAGDTAGWQEKLAAMADTLTTTCRAVDPISTDQTLEEAAAVGAGAGVELTP